MWSCGPVLPNSLVDILDTDDREEEEEEEKEEEEEEEEEEENDEKFHYDDFSECDCD